MTDYAPDAGGHFDSDVHRRVQAAVPNPIDQDPLPFEDVAAQVALDDELNGNNIRGLILRPEELEEVLADLEASGHSKKTAKGWQNTKSGFELLTGPPAGAVLTAPAEPEGGR